MGGSCCWRRLLIEVLRVRVCGNHAFPSFDLLLLHFDGSMNTMELVVESASIADGMTHFVSPPKRGNRRPTILARRHIAE